MKKIVAYLLIFFSIVGMVDAGYLTWEKVNNSIPPCSAAFKCGDVLNSRYANVGPVPLSAFGFFFYTGFLVLGSLLFIEKETVRVGSYSLPVPMLIGFFGLLGVLFSSYLVFIMGWVLQAWCLYCVVSAINCVILGILSFLLVILYKRSQT